ncbi:MAG: uracil-DNA glycosylase [Phycisphaerae bacterium]|nr:uracil-DNA glycosylase [Phycisphaerae bacterium]
MPRSRSRLFQQLCNDAARCRACQRMASRRAVLGPLNGTLTPKVLFIGEAPGRLGADRSRRPFNGDASGRNFETLLASVRLSREEVFITNAVLCCPADDQRNNPPIAAEIRSCLPFLQRTIELLRPPIVVTIGTVAMRAVTRLASRALHPALGARLSDVAGRTIDCGTFRWLPLYHPSPRVLHTVRTLAQQRADFDILSDLVD